MHRGSAAEAGHGAAVVSSSLGPVSSGESEITIANNIDDAAASPATASPLQRLSGSLQVRPFGDSGAPSPRPMFLAGPSQCGAVAGAAAPATRPFVPRLSLGPLATSRGSSPSSRRASGSFQAGPGAPLMELPCGFSPRVQAGYHPSSARPLQTSPSQRMLVQRFPSPAPAAVRDHASQATRQRAASQACQQALQQTSPLISSREDHKMTSYICSAVAPADAGLRLFSQPAPRLPGAQTTAPQLIASLGTFSPRPAMAV